jgi:hypothetical protein
LNIGLGGQFAMWSGSLIPLHARIVIIADTERRLMNRCATRARRHREREGLFEGGVSELAARGTAVDAIEQVSVTS